MASWGAYLASYVTKKSQNDAFTTIDKPQRATLDTPSSQSTEPSVFLHPIDSIRSASPRSPHSPTSKFEIRALDPKFSSQAAVPLTIAEQLPPFTTQSRLQSQSGFQKDQRLESGEKRKLYSVASGKGLQMQTNLKLGAVTESAKSDEGVIALQSSRSKVVKLFSAEGVGKPDSTGHVNEPISEGQTHDDAMPSIEELGAAQVSEFELSAESECPTPLINDLELSLKLSSIRQAVSIGNSRDDASNCILSRSHLTTVASSPAILSPSSETSTIESNAVKASAFEPLLEGTRPSLQKRQNTWASGRLREQPKRPSRRQRAVAGSLDALMTELDEFATADESRPARSTSHPSKKEHLRKPSGIDSLNALMSELQPIPKNPQTQPSISSPSKPAPKASVLPSATQPNRFLRPQRPSLLTKFENMSLGAYTMSPDNDSSSSSASSPLSTRSATRKQQMHRANTLSNGLSGILTVNFASSNAKTLHTPSSGGSSLSGSLASPLTDYEDDDKYLNEKRAKIAEFDKQAEKVEQRIERNVEYEKMVDVRRREQDQIEDDRIKMANEAKQFESEDRRWKEEEKQMREFMEDVERSKVQETRAEEMKIRELEMERERAAREREEAEQKEAQHQAWERKRKIDEEERLAKEETDRLTAEILKCRQEADVERAGYEEEREETRLLSIEDDEGVSHVQASDMYKMSFRQSQGQRSSSLTNKRLPSFASTSDKLNTRSSFESEYEDEFIYDDDSPGLTKLLSPSMEPSQSRSDDAEWQNVEKKEMYVRLDINEQYGNGIQTRLQSEAAEEEEEKEEEEEEEYKTRIARDEATRQEVQRQAALQKEMEEAEGQRIEDERLAALAKAEGEQQQEADLWQKAAQRARQRYQEGQAQIEAKRRQAEEEANLQAENATEEAAVKEAEVRKAEEKIRLAFAGMGKEMGQDMSAFMPPIAAAPSQAPSTSSTAAHLVKRNHTLKTGSGEGIAGKGPADRIMRGLKRVGTEPAISKSNEDVNTTTERPGLSRYHTVATRPGVRGGLPTGPRMGLPTGPRPKRS